MMTDLLLTAIFTVLLWFAYVWRSDQKALLAERTAPLADLPVVTPAPPPPPPPVSSPSPRDLVTVRLVSERGRPLGEIQVDRKARRPSLQWTPPGGRTANFVAESGAGRRFTYRRVGQERESA